jgi:hypothetical protein
MERKVHFNNIVPLDNVWEDYPMRDIEKCLRRHEQGDWGDISDIDKQANDYALNLEYPLISEYQFYGRILRIVTDAYRKETLLILLDEEQDVLQ